MFQERGVALLTALLVVALSTIIAVGMVTRQALDVRRTANLLQSEQAWLYHMAVEDHAAPLIERYWDEIELITLERYEELTALTTFGYQERVEGGVLGVELVLDLESRFNPNNLIQGEQMVPVRMEILQRLLQQIEVEPELVDALGDWIDPDQETRFNGAEDLYYQGLERPYRTADGPMVSLSELRLIRGVDSESYQKLLLWLMPLPSGSVLNVNWAGAELLQALHPEIGSGEAELIIERRRQEPFESVEAFNNYIKSLPAAAGVVREVEPTLLGVSPGHFAIRTSLEMDTITHRYQSILRRESDGTVTVLLRERVG
ncbi:MAG: type II secretion system minor pseudopilin GspK [Gammaproteobacteria bacterium]|nr:type II secretion system minor pseudopilin GspK [Gammaproteobacteria bacterium]